MTVSQTLSFSSHLHSSIDVITKLSHGSLASRAGVLPLNYQCLLGILIIDLINFLNKIIQKVVFRMLYYSMSALDEIQLYVKICKQYGANYIFITILNMINSGLTSLQKTKCKTLECKSEL